MLAAALLTFGLVAGFFLFVGLLLTLVFKLVLLPFKILKWVAITGFSVVGIVLLGVVAPVLLVVAGVLAVLFLPLLFLGGMVWAGAKLVF